MTEDVILTLSGWKPNQNQHTLLLLVIGILFMVIAIFILWNYSFKKYLKKVLYKYNNKEKIVMILDNVRYHHAKLIKPFLEKHDQKLELMYLPPYSPDLNPMERV